MIQRSEFFESILQEHLGTVQAGVASGYGHPTLEYPGDERKICGIKSLRKIKKWLKIHPEYVIHVEWHNEVQGYYLSVGRIDKEDVITWAKDLEHGEMRHLPATLDLAAREIEGHLSVRSVPGV